jgi:hypothetical protein
VQCNDAIGSHAFIFVFFESATSYGTVGKIEFLPRSEPASFFCSFGHIEGIDVHHKDQGSDHERDAAVLNDVLVIQRFPGKYLVIASSEFK